MVDILMAVPRHFLRKIDRQQIVKKELKNNKGKMEIDRVNEKET